MYAIVTHDVDSVKKPIKHVLKVRRRFKISDLVKHILHLTNLYNNIELVMDFEDQVGVRSTFFFPVLLFPLEEVLDEIFLLIKEGWEVGLHAVVERNQEDGIIKMQFDLLREFLKVSLKGVRSHYLIVNNKILQLYASLGFTYDSSIRVESLGRWDPTPLSCGIIEIPIGVMDADLFGRLHLSEEKAWRYIMWKVQKAVNEGARAITFLFHQESFRMRGGRLYSRLLWWLHEKEFDIIKCIDACNFLLREAHH